MPICVMDTSEVAQLWVGEAWPTLLSALQDRRAASGGEQQPALAAVLRVALRLLPHGPPSGGAGVRGTARAERCK